MVGIPVPPILPIFNERSIEACPIPCLHKCQPITLNTTGEHRPAHKCYMLNCDMLNILHCDISSSKYDMTFIFGYEFWSFGTALDLI